jgi:transposase
VLLYSLSYSKPDFAITKACFKSLWHSSISATARKLAVIIWNMLAKGQDYNPRKEYLYLDQKRKLKLVNRIKKNIAKFEIKPEDVGFGNVLDIST